MTQQQCKVCSKDTNSRCSRCKCVYYCSSQCQKDDYDTHKLSCGKWCTKCGKAARVCVCIIAPSADGEMHFTGPLSKKACILCRAVIGDDMFVCAPCRFGATDWWKRCVALSTSNLDKEKRMEKEIDGHAGLLSLLERASESIHPTPVPGKTSRWKVNDWPGFYCGNSKWEIPKYQGVSVEDLCWDNRAQVTERELNKLGIDLLHDIQYTSV
jgi:hypothetical protein